MDKFNEITENLLKKKKNNGDEKLFIQAKFKSNDHKNISKHKDYTRKKTTQNAVPVKHMPVENVFIKIECTLNDSSDNKIENESQTNSDSSGYKTTFEQTNPFEMIEFVEITDDKIENVDEFDKEKYTSDPINIHVNEGKREINRKVKINLTINFILILHIYITVPLPRGLLNLQIC